MSRLLPLLAMPLVLVATACVTINVYFPAAAAQQAADRVIDEVWGGRARPAPAVREPAPEEPTSFLHDLDDRLRFAGLQVLGFAMSSAQAQEEPDLQVDSPEIQRLTDAMEARFPLLAPHYESGALGLGSDGYIALRDAAAVPLSSRNQVRAWIANENADRASLYREIAMANGQPQWETQIRRVFADRWIERAPAGWWVLETNGAWRQK
ncbi:YdbL family protein [Panacagrimonas sp.]|uniref:YdbL family protein n=1 Tax=Panacagrimonas sp. TaxID=2480088 RepID=UPI003B516255